MGMIVEQAVQKNAQLVEFVGGFRRAYQFAVESNWVSIDRQGGFAVLDKECHGRLTALRQSWRKAATAQQGEK